MTGPFMVFLVLCVATICGAFLTLWSRYVVHAAFGLMISLLGVAGFYLLLGSDFLAVTQVVVYVGGVVVLYLFGVMLTPPDLEERSKKRIVVVGGIAVLALIGLLRSVFQLSAHWKTMSLVGPKEGEPGLIDSVGRSFLESDRFLLPFEVASVLLLVALVGAVFLARRKVEVDE
jgi:NADH-quinone oxidoreductase subunit J